MADAPKKSGLSLYAHLLGGDSASGSTISSAPVKYDADKAQDEAATAAAAQKKKDASLNFQPIKRPQVKAKPKASSGTNSSSAHKFSSSTTTASTLPPGASSTPSVQRSNFEDWIGDEDDEYFYQDRKQSNKRNNKKKKKQQQGQRQQEAPTWDWDDIYDPTRPHNYSDYKGSDEQYREHRDWKARLYYYQLKDAKKAKSAESAKTVNSAFNIDSPLTITDGSNPGMFAPPAALSFAPPSFDDDAPPKHMDVDEDDGYYPSEPPTDDAPPRNAAFALPSFAPPAMSDDAAGDDAYLRRMRMSGMPPPAQSPPLQSSPPKQTSPPVQPTPQLVSQPLDADKAAKIAEAQAKIAAFKAKMAKPPTPAREVVSASPHPPSDSEALPPPPPPEEPTGTISRAPVRYEVPPDQPPTLETADISPTEDQPRSKKPGQKGFAERLMNKYGWEKGQGLGASGEGITTALIGKAEKKPKGGGQGQKRSDPDGGRLPAVTMGKIIGGKRRKLDTESDDGRFGKMSPVVKLSNMLAGLDVQAEIEDNNLLQEVGEEMGAKYGTVERVFVWRKEAGGGNEVFVKFVSELSALRCVNGMEGMEFAGNEVGARFWGEEDFERGRYGGM